MKNKFNNEKKGEQPQGSESSYSSPGQGPISAPSISLPKGGGAIRGIGEKFAANPVTGTGSMTVPIAASPGRSGFGPQLSLSYDSGAGNGPFGFGWNLSLPSITRKTDKGLPKYQDADESDTFILSGAEDLVPVLKKQGNDWVPEDVPDRTIGSDSYRIKRYRPRIESLFARIERWTNTRTNETYWRSISRDNITTVYGRTTESRIEDSNATEGSPRVFSWLICESYDDKGNAIYYEYQPENSAGIDHSQTNERNRTDNSRSANRYLKRIKYGNKAPVEIDSNLPREFREDLSQRADWLFELVFDYEEGHYEEIPANPGDHQFVNAHKDPPQDWQRRQDPFSSYRSGFEVRTYRLCHRVLMFHHFPDELGLDDYLVRSTGFKYKESSIASFITSVTQSGFKRQDNGTYLKKSLPPLEFEYSEAIIQEKVQEIDEESLENIPQGLDGAQYQWVDIDGEGTSGILTEQGDSWFLKRNVSALPVIDKDGKPHTAARFAPTERLATIPSFTNLSEGRQQLLDLAGDGQLDVVELASPTPGFYERTKDEAWHTFRPFKSLPNVSWQDPNLKFVDLTGDGHADIFITKDDAFTWYESLAEAGFASGEKVRQALDEEKGPKLVFADGTQSIYLADFSGDGLTDLVRIRNGEVCYWPNLGYGRFGAKVTMDNSPRFDAPGHFDQRRIRLADIDASGVTDIIYLKDDGVYIYLNESGNRWADAEKLKSFPKIDNLSSIMAVDLLGNGTACLVWSSPLPAANGKQLRYIDLMGGQKPHLLVKTVNNLGAENHVHYAPSTKFYLADKAAGKPWITRIPFPVHVLERVETYDRISKNRFVTRYAYHHGYFDGVEREFRGFGMVEQWDTEEIGTIQAAENFSGDENLDEASFVPPVLTRTWFHTGAYIRGEKISRQFEKEYYREPGQSPEQLEAMLLPDTVLPDKVTLSGGAAQSHELNAEEIREACRALRGSILRQEVYARDGSGKEDIPYTASERSYEIKWLQPKRANPHAVFFVHPVETIDYHYERTLYKVDPGDPDSPELPDPRVSHQLNLEVDVFGNVLKSAAVCYGRRRPDESLKEKKDRDKQTKTLITYTENNFTNGIHEADAYRTPLPYETLTYEITGLAPGETRNGTANLRFTCEDILRAASSAEKINYEEKPGGSKQKRLIKHERALYRKDDLSAALPPGKVESMALPYDSYELAFTPGLLKNVFIDKGKITAADLAALLAGEGKYIDLNRDGHWWIPSNRVYFSPQGEDERAYARAHFFLPHRYRDPFGNVTEVAYDSHHLLMTQTTDPLGNTQTAKNSYRTMQPQITTGPNGNRSAVAFDALGMVVGTAVMGKPGEDKGDSLEGFEPHLDDNTIREHTRNPFHKPHSILKKASTRLVYDLTRYLRSRDAENPQPNLVYTMDRETHEPDLEAGQQTKIQHSFLYSDGFGREIQTKVQAEPGDAPLREDNADEPDTPGALILEDGKPKTGSAARRWVGTGRTIYNNKGKPIKKYEPFFSSTHLYETEPEVTETGVTPVMFYDPLERVVAAFHPNHTYEKVVFDPWSQETWDENDTLLQDDPRGDEDVGEFFQRLKEEEFLPTWHAARKDGQLGAAEKAAAEKTEAHANTPTVAFLDTLGRTFLTIADNGVDADGVEQKYETRVKLDLEGKTLSVTDARGSTVMEYVYSVQEPEEEDEDEDEEDEEEEQGNSHLIYQKSMDGGERWILSNAAGNPIRTWDSRNHCFSNFYDELQRPTISHVKDGDGDKPLDHVFEKVVYGDWKGMSPSDRDRAKEKNLLGKPKEQYDAAGLVTNHEYDFKGNLLRGSRQLIKGYKQVVHWNVPDPSALLETEIFISSSEFDALNRVVKMFSPHTAQIPPTEIIPSYNEANLLEMVEARLRNAADRTAFVSNIDYDSKGQRKLIEYGNGTKTKYTYDPLTYRLTNLKTTKTNNSKTFQDLYYTYDPVGNITEIKDEAQQEIYFNNQVVSPQAKYLYDALYRLIQAQGREHIGQDQPVTPYDEFRKNLPLKGDGSAVRNYIQTYQYDAVGNILKMIHQAGKGNFTHRWTRAYIYEGINNRLRESQVGSLTENYTYDEHGNMVGMPHLSQMKWDYEDRLQATSKQVVNNGGTIETTYYLYDAEGERVRKVTERQNGTRKNERLYLGGYEIYREYEADGSKKKLERETLHIMDEENRIALVETKTINKGAPVTDPPSFIRFQLGNHLGSASLELGSDAVPNIISYEEYYPYGSTSYQAVRQDIKVPPKRYRYTGKERDEETGFNYHGARYYAPWLARWISVDKLSFKEPENTLEEYIFCKNNPVVFVDPDGNLEISFSMWKSNYYKDPLYRRYYFWAITVQKTGVRDSTENKVEKFFRWHNGIRWFRYNKRGRKVIVSFYLCSSTAMQAIQKWIGGLQHPKIGVNWHETRNILLKRFSKYIPDQGGTLFTINKKGGGYVSFELSKRKKRLSYNDIVTMYNDFANNRNISKYNRSGNYKILGDNSLKPTINFIKEHVGKYNRLVYLSMAYKYPLSNKIYSTQFIFFRYKRSYYWFHSSHGGKITGSFSQWFRNNFNKKDRKYLYFGLQAIMSGEEVNLQQRRPAP